MGKVYVFFFSLLLLTSCSEKSTLPKEELIGKWTISSKYPVSIAGITGYKLNIELSKNGEVKINGKKVNYRWTEKGKKILILSNNWLGFGNAELEIRKKMNGCLLVKEGKVEFKMCKELKEATEKVL